MIPRSALFTLCTRHTNGVTLECPSLNTQARVFVLENDLFRVLVSHGALAMPRTWSVAPGAADVPFEGRDRLDVSPFACPPFQLTHQPDENVLVLETDTLKLCVNLQGLLCSWFIKGPDGVFLLGRDRQTQAYNFDGALGQGVFHYMERERTEAYYGLGERAGNTNRHGRRFRMRNTDPMGYDAQFTDPLYKHYPFYIVRKPEHDLWYGIYYDNMAYSELDMGLEMDNYHGLYRYYHAEDGDLDYYFWAGPTLDAVTRQFSRLTGKTLFPPRWSLGYSGSTMHYTDAPDAQVQMGGFLRNCAAHNIPCDSFQMSSGYTSIDGKRYVFNWNRDKFPDPKAMANTFAQAGVRLCANIKPGLLLDHPMHDELDAKGLFVRNATNTASEEAQFWDACGTYVDFTNPEAFAWWKAQVTEKLLRMGIGSTWNDNNEFEIWDDNAKTHGFGTPTRVSLLRPVLTLLMQKASFEAQKAFAPDERPYLISRSGCPGLQRYVQTWTGDNRTDWKTIEYNIKMGIGLSLSGVYNFGHDVGGFSGPRPDPEMFVRWVQNGIFWPRFTIHSWNDDHTVNEPWMYPEQTPVIAALIRFRYKIIPYMYTLLRDAVQNYAPIIRPTFMVFPHDERCYDESDDFMLGADLLVASVVHPGHYERRVYLPKAKHGWFDYHTGFHFAGGQNVVIPAPLTTPPLLVRAGAIVPVNTAKVGFGTAQADTRGFELFAPPATSVSHFTSYEDDGLSMAYEKGDFAELAVTMETTPSDVYITVVRQGPYNLPWEDVTLHVRGLNGRTAHAKGQSIRVTLI